MSPSMKTSQDRWIYIGAIVILVALVVIGLVTYGSLRATNQAMNKANQLADELAQAGYPRPDLEQVARTLGTDGGIVCEDPASALKTALWKINLANGAAGPGQRPVIVDRRAVEAGAIIFEVYCPEKLDKVRDRLDDLKTDDTVERERNG
ncbi:hypothetical protein [Streptomyces galilaeus]|uniref:hypothetical protein n=1 Tax=Streptomyces galilaeus TaxID=33899 RepID=UPI001677F208|nr:hypothetical protein [Streptomyces galilaeus]GGW79604.1 hypothetical protein GCM10010350_75540 [Streptomyces galilaeus]